MGKLGISNFILYRWRYYLGFAAIGLLLAATVLIVTFLSPGGISRAEMDSVVASTFTPPQTLLGQSPDHILHLPYRLFQKLSLAALDVNLFAIKLPSMVLATGSVLALYGLLRLWFRRNVAIISSIIAVVTGQFLMLIQLGTPAVGYIFWNAAILYSVSMLVRTEKYRIVWLFAATTFAALSMYSPLQIYIVVALLATCAVHPHARFVVLQIKNWALTACAVWFILLVTPLILSIVQQPSIAATLLGIPAQFSWPSLHIVRQQLLQYVGFSSPSSGTRISPAYGLGVVALALVGLYHLLTAKYTAKSYILTIWFLLLLPSIVSNPDAVMVTFVPVLLLVAYGIDYIIRSWYRLFPTNPYARVFGLIPLSVLVFGLIFSGVERFVYGYHYDPRSSGAFSNDLQLLDSVVDANKNKPILVVVPESMREFYTVYSDRKPVTPRVQVASALNPLPGGVTIVHHDSQVTRPGVPSQILVSRVTNNADRFYLYK